MISAMKGSTGSMTAAAAALLFVSALSGACGTGRAAQWGAGGTATDPAAPGEAVVAEDADPLIASAQLAWDQRGDRPALEKAIADWEALVAKRPNDWETYASLSRAYYLLAEGYLRQGGASDPQYLAGLEKGVSAGERALAALSPEFKNKVIADAKVEDAIKVVGAEGLPAMYWYAVNLGKWSRGKGIAALLGNKDRVYGVLSHALSLDETFFYGAPHRYFGAYWALVPVGRDLDKSLQHFEKSLAIAPDYVGTKVLMAESYAVKKQDRALFERLLKEAIETSDDAIRGLSPETRIEKQKARELLEKVDDLF